MINETVNLKPFPLPHFWHELLWYSSYFDKLPHASLGKMWILFNITHHQQTGIRISRVLICKGLLLKERNSVPGGSTHTHKQRNYFAGGWPLMQYVNILISWSSYRAIWEKGLFPSTKNSWWKKSKYYSALKNDHPYCALLKLSEVTRTIQSCKNRS